MWTRRIAVSFVATSACGRIGFDAGGALDASDAPAAACSAIVCDGFDQAGLDPRWLTDTAQGTVTLDTTRAHGGAASVHMHTNAIGGAVTNPRALLVSYAGLPVTGKVYVRAWVYFASPLPATPMNQVMNLADTPGNGISTGARDGYPVDNDYTTVTYAESTTVPMPLDRWTCLQLEVPSATSGTTVVSLDGAEVADITLTKSTIQPAPDHLYVGIEWVGTVSSFPAYDQWLDDIVVDAAPTSCAP